MRKMKDSGIEWIGEIPENWGVNRVKYLFMSSKGLSITKENLIEEGLPVISYGQIHSKTNTGTDIPEDLLRYVSYDYRKFSLSKIEKFDFAFADTSEDYDGCGNCVYKRTDDELYGGYHVVILKSRLKQDNRYFAYLFQTDAWRKQIRTRASGIKVFSITQKILNEASVIIPAIDEQQRIADYLDTKCEEIDTLAEDIQKEIGVLEEYKKSIITETVTKGLDPHVPMKDSGIEWIGEIPEDWSIKRVKFICNSLFKGNGITKETVKEDGNIQCVRYGEIYTQYTAAFTSCKSTTNIELISSPKHIKKGDLLFAGTGELIEEIGKNIVYMGNEPCLAGGDIIVMRHSQNPIFLNYALNSQYSQAQKSVGKAKLKVVHISAKEIGNITMALPPLKEQQRIADYLDTKCEEIDKIIKQKHEQLSVLEEYKKSLIYEYVTGKKEVMTS